MTPRFLERIVSAIAAIRWPTLGQFLLCGFALIQLIPAILGLLRGAVSGATRADQPERYWTIVGVGLAIGIPLLAVALVLYLRGTTRQKD